MIDVVKWAAVGCVHAYGLSLVDALKLVLVLAMTGKHHYLVVVGVV